MSENKLRDIPETLASLKALRVLRLQNNRLKSLPHALGEVVTLEDLDCAGNAEFEVVPTPLHSDTAMILWVCRLHKGKNRKAKETNATYGSTVFTTHTSNCTSLTKNS